MNECAWAFTFAWRNDEILLLVIIAETNFAGTLDLFSDFENSIELTQKDVFQDLLVFAFWESSDLNDFELNSANFDDISGFYNKVRITERKAFAWNVISVVPDDNVWISVYDVLVLSELFSEDLLWRGFRDEKRKFWVKR